MLYSIHVNQLPDYIHVKLISDPRGYEISKDWESVKKVCQDHHCEKVLVESLIAEPRISLQLFDLVYYLTKFKFNHNHKIAFVAQQSTHELNVAEKMIRNVTINGAIFTDFGEAIEWLQE